MIKTGDVTLLYYTVCTSLVVNIRITDVSNLRKMFYRDIIIILQLEIRFFY